MTTKISYWPLKGGENLLTPALSADPGRLRFSRNYECDRYGRYRRIDGYERFDGHPKPSEASYWVLNFDAGEGEISVGDTASGATSTATGEVLVVTVQSGTWGGSDASGYLILFNVSGTFQNNEDIEVSAVKKAVANGASVEQGATTDTNHNTWLQAAIEATRDDISAVPGSGSILGVWEFSGVTYAFRNNAGGTAAVMHKSSTSGWTECSLGEKLSFDTGSVAFIEGETVTQGGVTAVIRRVIVLSGTWAGADAAGYFTITGRSGGNFSAAGITGSVAGVANATGAEVAYSFSPSGRFEFINYNFGGHTNTLRMYGCDGANQAFEWDGTYFAFITTGMTTDTPKHINAHKNHLFLFFQGGSIQHSSLTDPFTWNAITGAAEISVGDEIVGSISMPNVLAIWARNSTWLLYGTSIDDWDLRLHSDESGAIEWTIQKIGSGLFLDDRGLTNLSAVQEYGDFASNIMSDDIQPFFESLRGYEIASLRVRKKNQYRLFFSDGQGINLTMDGNKVIGFTRLKYDDAVTCCCSSEDLSGNEELFFGDSSGFVYQLDKGTSFDGGAIGAYIQTHYNVLKSPSNNKRYRKITVELDAPNDITLYITPDYSYGADLQPSSQALSIDASGGFWDIDEWESFVWDGPSVSTGEARIDGHGKSISLNFYNTSIYDQPHTIQGCIIHYSMRRLIR